MTDEFDKWFLRNASHCIDPEHAARLAWFAALASSGAPTGAAPEQAAQQGLENCRLYAARYRKEEWAKVILRLCKAGGAIGSPLREPAAQTSGALLRFAAEALVWLESSVTDKPDSLCRDLRAALAAPTGAAPKGDSHE